MGRFVRLSLALVFACWTQSAGAAPAAPPADARTALAMQLLTVTNAQANMIRMSDLMEPNLLQLIAQSHPGLSQKALDALRVALHEEVQASMSGLIQQVAQIYVRHFSEQEMRTLLAFYGTGTGKKLLAEMPAVIKESAALGQAWGQQIGVLAGQRALARLKNQGYKI
jgi:uncharacterized protein